MTVLKRGVAAAAVVAAMAQLLLVGPAAAATGTCQALPGSTPAAGADVDGDGTEDARLPEVSGVTLCVGADVVLSGPPTIDREQCGGFGSCMTYWVNYELTGYVDAGATLCYSVDGTQRCSSTNLARIPLDLVAPGRMCIGYDLRGGFPCPNGGPIELDTD